MEHRVKYLGEILHTHPLPYFELCLGYVLYTVCGLTGVDVSLAFSLFYFYLSFKQCIAVVLLCQLCICRDAWKEG